tara:strand:+ start:596 stop:1900 length:1305 start_codon:yes stop_codon:yes gene_type:complete
LPSFLVFLNYYSSDSFIFPLGIVLITETWRILSQKKIMIKNIVHLSVFIGFCALVKLSFLPVFIAISCALLYKLSDQFGIFTKKFWKFILVFICVSLSVFALGCITVLPNLYKTVLRLLSHSDAKLSVQSMLSFLDANNWLNVPHYLFIITQLAILIALFFILFKKNKFSINAEYKSKLILLLVAGLLYFYYAFSIEYNGSVELGLLLRNAYPLLLFIPFSVIILFNLFRASAFQSRCLKPQLFAVNIFFSFVFVVSVSSFVLSRSTLIEDANSITSELVEISRNISPSAINIGSLGAYHSFSIPASFHFWGNYRYARLYFDEELQKKFPNYTPLQMRGYPKEAFPDNNSIIEVYINKIKKAWKLPIGQPYYGKNFSFFSKAIHPASIRSVIIPAETIPTKFLHFYQSISETIRVNNVVTRDINGQNWYVFYVN